MQASGVFVRSLRRALPRVAPACWAALVAVAWLALVPAARAAPRAHATAEHQNAFVIGSSSVGQSLGRILERELEERGYEVRRKGVSSAGLGPDIGGSVACAAGAAFARRAA